MRTLMLVLAVNFLPCGPTRTRIIMLLAVNSITGR
jgi:hypothetical protein